MANWYNLQVKWFPYGVNLKDIPNNIGGHTFGSPDSLVAQERAQAQLKTYRDRGLRGAMASHYPHHTWFDGVKVSNLNGVWVYGWFNDEPAVNELGEVAP